jgi:phage tail sheath protein FI
MSTLTIASPGVQINEVDLSQLAQISGSTNVFMTGFASQGPTNSVINVTSISEYENTFGTPTNAAERYLYQSARQLLNTSPANLLVTRMPYGSGAGAGYSNQYTALVYPISSNASTYVASSAYQILAPTSILLTDEQYIAIRENNVTWGTGYTSGAHIQSFADLQNYGGLVILDSAKTAIDDLYQGLYVGICDNSNVNPATDFTAIQSVQATNAIVDGNYQTFTTIPSSRLNFSLTQSFSAGGTSISQIIEQYPTAYNFGSSFYNDCLTVMVFKIQTSIYAQNSVVLTANVNAGYTGSFNSNRTQNNPLGGAPNTFSLQNVANSSSDDIRIAINPNISNVGYWTNPDGTSAKTVRVDSGAKNLYSEGVYIPTTNQPSSDVGNIPLKLQTILQNIDNLDLPLDVTCEAGLGTIWAGANTYYQANSATSNAYIFDDTLPVDTSALQSQTGQIVGGLVYNAYQSVATQFVTFAESTRKDHIFIADPLRNIFVQGANTKVSSTPGYNFSQLIYWPLQNLYAPSNTSYAATYANWLLVNDTWSNQNVWVPSSAWVAGLIATTSQNGNPWDAPAGYTRGGLTNVLDIAINPSQKQRDLLYRINQNPIASFSGEGIVVFGQKTLYTFPSAFDRINVRRLFLVLEKATKSALRFYVFEPNNYTTQTRLVNTLTPIFNQALNSNGVYAYKIVCDNRNNPPAVIDNNQLNVAIYIQPVRTAEFILCDFIATQTGVNFNEIIAQGTF